MKLAYRITYVMRDDEFGALQPGWVVLGLAPCDLPLPPWGDRTVHIRSVWEPYWESLVKGLKTFEVRREKITDVPFDTDDFLILEQRERDSLWDDLETLHRDSHPLDDGLYARLGKLLERHKP